MSHDKHLFMKVIFPVCKKFWSNHFILRKIAKLKNKWILDLLENVGHVILRIEEIGRQTQKFARAETHNLKASEEIGAEMVLVQLLEV